jgi:hypothetical protein
MAKLRSDLGMLCLPQRAEDPGGHWDETWTGSTNKNRLQDFLPQQLEDGGIMTGHTNQPEARSKSRPRTRSPASSKWLGRALAEATSRG